MCFRPHSWECRLQATFHEQAHKLLTAELSNGNTEAAWVAACSKRCTSRQETFDRLGRTITAQIQDVNTCEVQ